MARRRLGLSTAEWRGLSWWERETYIEGFMDEELIKMSDPEEEWSEEPSEDIVENRRAAADPVDASSAGLRSLGLTVIDGG
jgi:hypothetical protein